MRGASFIGLGLGLLMLVFGCSKQVTNSTTSEVEDSTYVREVPRYVEVKVPGETVTVTEYIECDSNTNKPKPIVTKAKAGKAKVDVKVDSTGKLTATGGCDSLTQVVKAMDKEIFRLRHEKKETVRVVTKIEYKTRWYDKAARWIAVITLTLIGFFIYTKFK